MVSSDLTSHIPAQEGLELEVEGQGPGRTWVCWIGGGSTEKLGLGAAQNLEVLSLGKPESTSHSSGPQSPCFSSHLLPSERSCGPHSCDAGIDLVPIPNKECG